MERSARKRRPGQQSKEKKIQASDNEDFESDESVSSDLELQVEFEGKAIQEQDFDGIKQLLLQLFLKADVNVDELVELIVSQNNIGSTIKLCASVEEEEEEQQEEEEGEKEKEEEQVCGIATVVNLSFHKEKLCAKKLMDHILNQSREHNTASGHTQFSHLLKNTDVQLGWLFNARFLNIPPHLVIPLFKSLRLEMEEACEKGLPYSFQHFVVVARSHQSPCPQQPKKTKKAKTVELKQDELVFDHFECELMHQESVASFSYPVSEDSDSVIGGSWSFDDQAMKPFRTVMIIPATALEKIVVMLESAL